MTDNQYVAAKLFDAEKKLREACDILCEMHACRSHILGDDDAAVESLWRSLYSTSGDGRRLDLYAVATRVLCREVPK